VGLSNVIAVSQGESAQIFDETTNAAGRHRLRHIGRKLLPDPLTAGNPATVILGFGATPEAKAILYKQLGLNKPIYLQYFVWLGNIFTATSVSRSFPRPPCPR